MWCYLWFLPITHRFGHRNINALCKSLRITLALQISRNKNHFTSLSAVDVRVRSEQWAGKVQWSEAQTLEIRVVFTDQVQAVCSSVPTRTNTHTTAGPPPLLLLASGPPARATLRGYPILLQSVPAIFWEWDIQLAFFLSVFTYWEKVIVSLRLRMNQAVLTLSLLTGVQKSNQLLINTCDKINLIFFLKQRG